MAESMEVEAAASSSKQGAAPRPLPHRSGGLELHISHDGEFMGVDPVERAGGVRWRARWVAGGKRRSLTVDSELAAAEAYAKGIEEAGGSSSPSHTSSQPDAVQTMAERRVARGKERMAKAAEEMHDLQLLREGRSDGELSDDDNDDSSQSSAETSSDSEDDSDSAWKVCSIAR